MEHDPYTSNGSKDKPNSFFIQNSKGNLNTEINT